MTVINMEKGIATVGIWIGIGILAFSGVNAVMAGSILTVGIWILGCFKDIVTTAMVVT